MVVEPAPFPMVSRAAAPQTGSGACSQEEPAESPSAAPSMATPLKLLLFVALLVPSAARPPAANASAAPTVLVTMGVLLPELNLRYPWAWPRVAPALSLALEALQPQPGLAVRTVFASTENKQGTCDPKVALLKAAELKGSHDPDVLLGPGCLHTRELTTPLAELWQLPLLRAGDSQLEGEPPTEVFLGPVGPPLGFFRARLLRHFNWTSRAVLLVNPTIQHENFNAYSLWRYEERRADASRLDDRVLLYLRPDEAIWLIQANGRVAFICGSLETLQQIMQLAQAQNMTNGDYVFFYLDIFGESLRAEGHREEAKPWQRKESNDTGGLREAFQMVLVITAHEPQTPEYQHFQSQLILRAQRDFGVAINDSMENLVAGCFHDGLLLYLKALNETLHEGGTKRDTSRILEKMRSLKIQGVTGMVSINSKNYREMDFDLWAMKDVESGEYQVVAHYIGSEKQLNWTGPIHWKKGGPPHDNPRGIFDMRW